MSYGGQHGKPDDEMFLSNPTSATDSPAVGPLRISKRDTPSPAAPNSGNQSTSSLPYPDDGQPQPQQTQPSSQAPYPDNGPGARVASPDYRHNSPGPAGSVYQTPQGYPAALRPREGRESRQSTLAERRGNAPVPLPDSAAQQGSDNDGLFQRNLQRPQQPEPPQSAPINSYPQYQQQHWPPPAQASADAPATAVPQNLQVSNPNSVNRISSTASTSTTKAQRGSPPPPETPVAGPGQQPASDIEARYAAAGIAGTSTLTSLQAQNAAAQQRANQYAGQQSRPGQQNPQGTRPWTPTEVPGTQPHGPPTVYQGPGEASGPPSAQSPPPGQTGTPYQNVQPGGIPQNALEQDFQRMHVSSSPPPAYSSVPGSSAVQGYPNEKGQVPAAAAAQSRHTPVPATVANIAPAATVPASNTQNHPAFANDPRQQHPGVSPQSIQNGQPIPQQAIVNASPAPSTVPPASPPPLPEGWIAHLDPNSGQYYYIHLPTQSTQWEFPKGPTPLNLNEPLSPSTSSYAGHALASPGLSTFGGKPLTSPGLPITPGYDGSVMSLNSGPSGFTGPPPSSGMDLYKVAPTNGVYFGPYLRYTNMDIENGLWLGSILLVTDAPQPPTIHIHQSIDLSPNPRQLKATNISVHQRWTFYKYEVDLKMDDAGPAKWTYAITSHLGCTRYEFLVAGRHETNWRFVATSGNEFSLNVNANERARLGGVGYMWKDIMQKHVECGGFHAQLGLGSQISADRLWKEIPSLKQWLAMSGKEARKNAAWTATHEEDISHAFFHYYTSHFDQPHLREAFAQIPHILQIDDHDL